MKTFILFVIVLLIFVRYPQLSYSQIKLSNKNQISQSCPDTLRVWQSFFSLTGFKYQYGNKKISINWDGNNIKQIVEKNPFAYKEVKTFGNYQKSTFISTILSLIIIQVGIEKKEENLLYIGSGCLVTSFVFDQIGYWHLKKGVTLFNKQVKF